MRRLIEVKDKVQKEIIPFPLVFQKLCTCFSMPKEECWEILRLLRDMGMIKIEPFHGVRII